MRGRDASSDNAVAYSRVGDLVINFILNSTMDVSIYKPDVNQKLVIWTSDS